jgi:hypothetical protein
VRSLPFSLAGFAIGPSGRRGGPTASRVRSRPRPPDQELDQPAKSRRRASAGIGPADVTALLRPRERDYRWQLILPCHGFSEDAAPRHATTGLLHPSKPIAPSGPLSLWVSIGASTAPA